MGKVKIRVGVSEKHIHLSKDDIELLFGAKYMLTKVLQLTQQDEYACQEKVKIISEHNTINNVRVIGPVRDYTQIEISKSDAMMLKIDPPVRNSGDLKNSFPITIEGPNGIIKKSLGCIIATRHLHMNFIEANSMSLKNNDKVSIFVNGEKGGIMHNVFCKVQDTYSLELHIDRDDANAFLLKTGDYVYLQ